MRSEFYFAIIGALALIVLILLITVIVVAVAPSAPKVYFDHFTAECTNLFTNGDETGITRNQIIKEVVFSTFKWYKDLYFEGEIISREFSNDDDDSTTTCQRIGNHDNCYVLSAGGAFGFIIPGSAELQQSEVDCSAFSNKKRQFDECDVYTYSQGSNLIKVIVESKNNYPVMVETVDASSQVTITRKIYLSFNPETPTDKSGLKPFAGVKVYDFRDGKGDAGDGESNVYIKDSKSEPFARSFLNKLSLKIFGVKSQNEKYHRQMIHMLPRGLPSKYVSRSVRDATREIRDIPTSFDARENWPYCKPIISTIRDQGSCGSCWAVSSSSVLSDRYCIATGAKVLLSPQYLVYCAPHNNGCSGAQNDAVIWEDIFDIGIPPEYCVPYEGVNGVCPTRCEDGTLINESMLVYPSDYNIPWAANDAARVEAIQKEIMLNGPVEAFYWFFSDFEEFFKSSKGIYHRSAEAHYDGGHAVRIIGWGREAGEDYWLIANSYGTDYPAEGLFRMRRGNNECNIEEQVVAGIFA